MSKSDKFMGLMVRTSEVDFGRLPSQTSAASNQRKMAAKAVPPVADDWWSDAQAAEVRTALGEKRFVRRTPGVFAKLGLK